MFTLSHTYITLVLKVAAKNNVEVLNSSTEIPNTPFKNILIICKNIFK